MMTATQNTLLCDEHESQLVVVDVQTKLMNTMQQEQRELVEENITILVKSAALLSIPIIVTEQYSKRLGETVDVIKHVIPDSVTPFDKTCFSCDRFEDFSHQLASSNRMQTILCGIEAHVCILQTALDLHKRGQTIFVVSDAICSRSDANKQNAIQRMQQLGITITNTESVLFEWLKDSKHQQFKNISAMIR